MDFDLKEFLRLQDLAQQKQRALDRAQGELDSLVNRLKSEFGCTGTQAAQTLLGALQAQQRALNREYADKLLAWQSKYGGRLNG